MKLLIAVPSVEYIHYKFAESLNRLTRALDDEQVNYNVAFESGSLVYLERDNLVKHAANGDFTHILWLDADMVFPDTIAYDLMLDDLPFVSAMCVSRHKNYRTVLFDDLKKSHRFDEIPDEIFEIEGCGMACCFMESKIPIDIMNHEGTCFCPTPRYGEDLAFCEKVLKYGYKMYADPNVKVGHIGHVVLYPGSQEPI